MPVSNPSLTLLLLLIDLFIVTLEHLENTFYTDALNKFDQSAFAAAGFPAWVRNRSVHRLTSLTVADCGFSLEQVSNDEASHVAFLTSALGNDAVQACSYKFPYTDPTSFVARESHMYCALYPS